MTRILILGYYDKLNFGDDIFKFVFDKYLRNFTIDICNLDLLDDIINKLNSNIIEPYDCIVIGGGDVINNYYFSDSRIEKIRDNFINVPIYFYGIGLSYPSMLSALDIGDYYFIRNKTDYGIVKDRYSTHYTNYTPDLAYFLLEETSLKTYKNINTITNKGELKIGVCLPYTWFVNNNDTSNKFLLELSSLIGELSQKHLLYIVPFDISNNPKNSDLILLQKFKSILRSFEFNKDSQQRIFYIDDFTRSKEDKTTEGIARDITKMIDYFKEFDCVIASRYHSVIMSMLTETPFISLYTTRKVNNIKSEVSNNLHEYFINLETDSNNVPVKIDKDIFNQRFSQMISNYDDIRDTIRDVKKYLYGILKNTFSEFTILLEGNKSKRSAPPKYLSDDKIKRIIDKTIRNVLRGFKLETNKNVQKIYKGESVIKMISSRLTSSSTIQKKIAEEILWTITGDPFAPYYYGLYQNAHNRPLVPQLEWIITDYYQRFKHTERKTDTIKIINKNFQELHRSGWQFIINNLIIGLNKRDDITSHLIIDTYIDKTFHWNKDFYKSKNIIPYKQDWIGFIHHTYSDYVNHYNCETLFNEELFISSLEHCRCLIVMSKYLKDSIDESLDKLYRREINPLKNKVTVKVVYHPSEITKDLFSYQKFLENSDKQIIQIGNWLRNVFSIYELHLPTTSVIKYKSVLKNKNSDNYFLPNDFFDTLFDKLEFKKPNNIIDMCRITFDNLHLKGMYEHIIEMENSVKVIEYLDNNKYDKMLTENIVFVKYVDASASNTVIECILRNTPILVNPIQPVVELLGEDYPLYYNSMYEASKMLEDIQTIKNAYNYLCNMDKTRFYIDTFIKDVKEIILNVL